jgi:hypothetical protein
VAADLQPRLEKGDELVQVLYERVGAAQVTRHGLCEDLVGHHGMVSTRKEGPEIVRVRVRVRVRVKVGVGVGFGSPA